MVVPNLVTNKRERTMKQCEYEDSTNCIWDAQKQGNGEGYSFVDIDGSVYYTDDPTVYDDVWTDEGESFPYQYVIAQVNGEEQVVVTWTGETMVEELAETGAVDVVSGALLGIALVITGVVTMMKGRRVA